MLRRLTFTSEQLAAGLTTTCESSAPGSRSVVGQSSSHISPPGFHRGQRLLGNSSRLFTTSSSSARSVEIERFQHFDPKPALDSAGRVPIAPYDAVPLACSAPSYPKGHLIIHPYTQQRPQDTWPAAIEAVCPFVYEISNRVKSQLAGWGYAFSDGDVKLTASKQLRFPKWDVATPKVARPVKGDATEDEEFLISIYQGNGTHACIGPYSLRSLPTDLTPHIDRALQSAPIPSARYPKKTEEAHIYVCTHGSRDCRCGVVGAQLVQKLREEVRTHEVRVLGEGSKKIKVFGVSHIGGHKWAANALNYPAGDWYGNLRVSDSPLILRAALGPSTSRHDLTDQRERLVHWPRWRGRLGLSEEKMRKVWEEWGGGGIETAVLQPIIRRRVAITQSTVPPTRPSAVSAAKTEVAYAIPFRKHDGEVILCDAKIGDNLKDVAQRAGLEEIEATCGGKCECATCHAYLASSRETSPQASEMTYASESDLNEAPSGEVIPVPTDEESDMLDYAISRKPTSRLLCQVTLTPELIDWFRKGGRIQLARY